MRKYLSIFKAEFLSSLQYIFNIAFGSLTFLIFVATFYYVWQAIYSDPNELLNGYSMSQMVWYLAITEVIYVSTKASKLCKEVNYDVKSGNITYNLNKPYSYVSFVLFKQLGKCFMQLVIYMLIALVVVSLLLGGIPNLNLAEFLLVFFSCFLAQIIASLIIIFIGLIAFYMGDSTPLYWLYSKFLLLVGVIFPIEFFPPAIQEFIVYSPVYVTAYGPAKLFVDFSLDVFINVMIAQILYIFISYGLCVALYNSAAKRLNVNGG